MPNHTPIPLADERHKLISPHVGQQIAEELERAANIIADFYGKHRADMPGFVASALTRETCRLRELAAKVRPEPPAEEA